MWKIPIYTQQPHTQFTRLILKKRTEKIGKDAAYQNIYIYIHANASRASIVCLRERKDNWKKAARQWPLFRPSSSSGKKGRIFEIIIEKVTSARRRVRNEPCYSVPYDAAAKQCCSVSLLCIYINIFKFLLYNIKPFPAYLSLVSCLLYTTLPPILPKSKCALLHIGLQGYIPELARNHYLNCRFPYVIRIVETRNTRFLVCS